VVNPTSTSYSAVTLTFNNAGIAAQTATRYLIDGPNNNIIGGTVPMTPISGGFSVTVPVPPNSVSAVSIQ
jgi:hypothetical protein